MLSQASEGMAAVVQDISDVCTVCVIMQLHGISAHRVAAAWKQLVGMSMVIMMHQTQHYSVQCCADHLPAQQQTSHKQVVQTKLGNIMTMSDADAQLVAAMLVAAILLLTIKQVFFR